MLRSWIDRLRIYLHPEQVVIVRQSGLFKRRITAKQVISVNESDQSVWGGALKALQAALNKPEWQQASAKVILSDSFCKYRITPWNEHLTEAEKTVLLHHQFGEIYGETAKSWQITTSDSGFGKPYLACAVDIRLMEDIQKACTTSGVRLTSVQPYLMTAFNRWRHKIESKGAWLIFAEKSQLSISLIQQGAWCKVRTQHCAPGWEESLDSLLAREALPLGIDAAAFPVHFFCTEQPHFKLDLPAPFKVQTLHLPIMHGYSPQGDQHIAAALCA